MKNILKALDNIEEKIIAVLLPFMCIVVFLSTFFRYTELLIIPWGEELARYLMVWIVFLGIAAGAKQNRHFGVGVLVQALPKSIQKYYEIFRVLVIGSFLTFVIVTVVKLMQLQVRMEQTSPSLGIPMWLAYLAVPVGCGLMILRQIQYTWSEQKKNSKEME